MAGIKLQGVDSIKFDDTEAGGQLSNLGVGKDVRPMKVKYALFFQTILPLMFAGIFLLLAFVVNIFAPVLGLISLYSFHVWSRKRETFLRKQKGLFDEPKYLKYNKKAAAVDYVPKEIIGEVKSATGGIGKGVFFFGHEMYTSQEIHAEDGKVRTHIIIFGTTGSGKTENIISLCVNFLTQASGFILVDGKGDTLLFAKTFSLVRAFGRTDDLYLLNFMDEGKADGEKRVEIVTNTFNFLVDSTAAEANEIIGGLLPNDSNGGSGMWEGRAATGINSLNKAIYYLKENGYIEIDPDTYRGYFSLDEFVELAMNEDIPKEKRGGLFSILNSINYKVPTEQEPNPKQNPATEEQFQYITMQYTETFNMLAEQYAHITVSQVPDISITDVVLRRRILLVLLPALAKSEQSVRNLGRIIIAMTRNVSSKAIGSRIEGDTRSTIESKPTSAISSFGLIFDEFGAYATKGASTLPAQVRSLNMVCVFAGQDYEAFKKGDEIEAATIFANCTIKLIMKIEDPGTYEKFKESAGETYVMVQEGYEAKETIFGRKYRPAETARVEKKPVLDIKDLKEQANGQETMIYGSKTYRLCAFYADPYMTPKARLNHMLEIRRPNQPSVKAMRDGVDAIYRKLRGRLDDDWENHERAILRLITDFLPSEYTDSLVKLDKIISKGELEMVPTETQIGIFAMSVFAKRVDLVDLSIDKALKESMGVEVDEDSEYDDDDIFMEDDGLIGFDDEPVQNEPMIIKNKSIENNVEDNSANPEVNTDDIPDSIELMRDFGDDGDVSDKFDIGASEDVLKQIEKSIKEKTAILEKGKQDSFDSLLAINLDAFSVQEGIEKLEDLLLNDAGIERKESGIISKLTSQNIVTDMGMKTNVAIISGPSIKRTNPSRSSQEVRGLIKGINDARN